MARIDWHLADDRIYENGVDRCVFYVDDDPGVVWPGITNFVEQPKGGEARPYYIDGVKYINFASREEFEATISAFLSPPEFDVCDGTATIESFMRLGQQRRKSFGLTYRTMVGSELSGLSHGYKIHLVYGATASPTTRKHETLKEAFEPEPLSWKLTTKAVPFPGLRPTSHIIIDTTKVPIWITEQLKNIIYGTETTPPRLPFPQEILDLFEVLNGLVVVDHEDGTFSVIGPDEAVVDNGNGTWSVTWPSAESLTVARFRISSY